jgi:hypothetical protein
MLEKEATRLKKVLNESDISPIYKNKEFSSIQAKIDDAPSVSDFYLGVYNLMKFVLTEFADSAVFRQDLVGASSRPSFLHSNATRRRIFDRINELDRIAQRSSGLLKEWSAPFDEHGGITEAIKCFVER